MKRNPRLDPSRQRMAPGQLARDGFLGEDSRNVEEIVAADEAVLEAGDVTREEVADLLDELHRVADEGLEAPRPACDGRATVQLVEVMGRMPCPFGCGHLAHKAVIRVRAGDLRLEFAPLHAHMLREHGFLEGRGSPMRLEPTALLELYRACREQ